MRQPLGPIGGNRTPCQIRERCPTFQPSSFRPSSNPDELVMSDLKLGVGQREPTADKKELEHQVCEYMGGSQGQPGQSLQLLQKIKREVRGRLKTRYAAGAIKVVTYSVVVSK